MTAISEVEEILRNLHLPLPIELGYLHFHLLICQKHLEIALKKRDLVKRKEILAKEEPFQRLYQEKAAILTKPLPSALTSTDLTTVGLFLKELLETHYEELFRNTNTDEDLLEGVQTLIEEIQQCLQEEEGITSAIDLITISSPTHFPVPPTTGKQEENKAASSRANPLYLQNAESLTSSPPPPPTSLPFPSSPIGTPPPLPKDFLIKIKQFSVPLPPPLPLDKSFHVFLTHNWAEDVSGRSNHKRVSRVNHALKTLGFITWFDEERMSRQVRQTMAQALYTSAAVICFITSTYEAKVNSADPGDNCYYEFNIASTNRRLVRNRIVVAMEKKMLDPNRWQEGRLHAEVGGEMVLDLSEDEDDAFIRQCASLVVRLNELLTSS